MIKIIEDKQVFILENEKSSYAIRVIDGEVYQIYFGEKLADVQQVELLHKRINGAYSVRYTDNNAQYMPTDGHFEYPVFGKGDFRIHAISTQIEDDCSLDFKYYGYQVLSQKPCLSNGPHMRDGGETLILKLHDEKYALDLELYYTLYEEGVIVKNCVFYNNGDKIVQLIKCASGCIGFDEGEYELITLSGKYGFERNMQRVVAKQGTFSIQSTRGMSSHQHNPFLAITKKDTTEELGFAYGVQLIYSGNFYIETETDEYGKLRVVAGVPFIGAGKVIKTGERFIAPEMVIVASYNGLGDMSRKFHDVYRNHLINPNYVYQPRPIVVNSWEGTYMNFNEEKLCKMIRACEGLGVDTFVLDDGWFGKRDNDKTSLGDWFVHTDKLPNGLNRVIKTAHECGMQFGLWFEPECISKESELYKNHPDWVLCVENRDKGYSRNQLSLDFSKSEVVEYVFTCMKAILEKYQIRYIKWDLNRNLTGVKNTDIYLRYMDGVYGLYEKLLAEFPTLFIEGCAGGGGRFDAGILYYSPQIWTSDNSDAYSRSFIQYATSLCYPLSTMSNHYSVCPNHQTNRTTPSNTRANIAYLGAFGYEFDPLTLSETEREEMKKQIATYKRIQELIFKGDVYRLENPFEGGKFCMSVVDKDKSRAIVVFMQGISHFIQPPNILYLRGLDNDKKYTISGIDGVFEGQSLMKYGIRMQPLWGDCASTMLEIIQYNENKKL